MKRFAVLIALMVSLTAPWALAEDALIDALPMEDVARYAPFDAGALLRDLASGEAEISPDAALDYVKALVADGMRGVGAMLTLLLAPAFVWAVTRQFADGENASASHICYCVCAATLTGLFTRALGTAKSAVETAAGVSEAVYPVLSAVLAATGGASTAAMFTPSAAMAGGMLSSVVKRCALPLCAACAAVTVAGGFGGGLRLNSLASLMKTAFSWVLGACMASFLGVLTVQGLLGAGYDGIAARTAKYTVDNLLPVVGGDVADTLDVAVSSALLVKNAVGVTGMLTLLAACAKPVVELTLTLCTVRLAAALAEPVAPGAMQTLLEKFASVTAMLLAAVAVALMLVLALTGAVIAAGNTILALR